ncbi:MAG: NAD-dependent epimerase/dehydratase family protein [bacterium]|nr:NAD-dependent epimerase/dehydratase family protein [bacterium]
MSLSKKILKEDVAKVASNINTSPLNGSKILLLGANGLIGSYIAHFFDFLNEDKDAGIEMDLITKSEITSTSRIYDLVGRPGINFITQDAAKYCEYEKTFDFIIHSAGYSAPSDFFIDPITTIDVNYIGMKSILESCLKNGSSPRILYLSSSEIYGSPTSESYPTPETYFGWSSVTNNRACYIESKRLTEVLSLNFNKLNGSNVKIARLALAYGPGMGFDDKRVIGQFMAKAFEKKVIDMVDDGRDLRCFCYISDALQQLIYILLYAKDTIYNVGATIEEVSIKDVAMMVGEIMGANVLIGPGKTDAVKGAPTRVCLDLGKIEVESGFKASVLMIDGLKRTVDWNLGRVDNSSNFSKK